VPDAVAAAARGGLDYLILGTIFESRSKPGRPALGPEAIGDAARMIDLPLLAIGGVTLSNVAEVASRGAAGVAAIGLFVPGTGLAQSGVVARLRDAFER
jgi:thiamine-phosphate pyrophosphorylase